MDRITIIDYGVGNLASLENAFRYLDVPVEVTADRENIAEAEKLLLPGVGAFAPAMEKLREMEMGSLIRDKVGGGTPLLGICLGMQLLFTKSYEQGEWDGLDLVPGRVVRFQGEKKIPHMGWNRLDFEETDTLLQGLPEEAYVYFVHSYYCIPEQPEMTIATCAYGERFAAAVRHGNVWGLQFHPEKSQDVGLAMLRNFAERI